MTHQLLNGSNVIARLEQMRRKGVTKRMTAGTLRDSCSSNRLRNIPLHNGRMEVPAYHRPVVRQCQLADLPRGEFRRTRD